VLHHVRRAARDRYPCWAIERRVGRVERPAGLAFHKPHMQVPMRQRRRPDGRVAFHRTIEAVTEQLGCCAWPRPARPLGGDELQAVRPRAHRSAPAACAVDGGARSDRHGGSARHAARRHRHVTGLVRGGELHAHEGREVAVTQAATGSLYLASAGAHAVEIGSGRRIDDMPPVACAASGQRQYSTAQHNLERQTSCRSSDKMERQCNPCWLTPG